MSEEIKALQNEVSKMAIDVAVTKNDVSEIKKSVTGNGQPGLTRRVESLERSVSNIITVQKTATYIISTAILILGALQFLF